MYAWERDALGIDTLGELKGSVATRMKLETGGSGRHAWWIATLFGPDFWTHWRVGLLRPTLFGVSESPISPPQPLILGLPKYLAQRVAGGAEPMDFIAVSPAIIEEKALAFAVVGATAAEVSENRVKPNDRWALVAPSDLVQRLKLVDGASIFVRLLPAESHMADRPHGH